VHSQSCTTGLFREIEKLYWEHPNLLVTDNYHVFLTSFTLTHSFQHRCSSSTGLFDENLALPPGITCLRQPHASWNCCTSTVGLCFPLTAAMPSELCSWEANIKISAWWALQPISGKTHWFFLPRNLFLAPVTAPDQASLFLLPFKLHLRSRMLASPSMQWKLMSASGSLAALAPYVTQSGKVKHLLPLCRKGGITTIVFLLRWIPLESLKKTKQQQQKYHTCSDGCINWLDGQLHQNHHIVYFKDFFWGRVFLYGLGCFSTCDPPVSAFQGLGFWVCTTMCSSNIYTLFVKYTPIELGKKDFSKVNL
jgi:hypothetical protein